LQAVLKKIKLTDSANHFDKWKTLSTFALTALGQQKVDAQNAKRPGTVAVTVNFNISLTINLNVLLA